MTRALLGWVAGFGLFAVLAVPWTTARVSAANLPAVDQLLVPVGEAPTQCRSNGRTRAGQAAAQAAYTRERPVISALLLGSGEQAARTLFDHYLHHGVVSSVREDLEGQEARSEFAADPQTVAAYGRLRGDLDAATTHFWPTDAAESATGTFRGYATERAGSFQMNTSRGSVHGAAPYMAINYTPAHIVRHATHRNLTGLADAASGFVSRLGNAAHRLLGG